MNNVQEDIGHEDVIPEASINTMEDLFVVNEAQQSKQSTSRKRPLENGGGEPSKRKSTAKPGPNWAILEGIWPASERPPALQDMEWVEKQTIGDLMTLHKV